MSLVYIVFARFDLLSFERQEKYVRPIVERMKSFTKELDLDIAKLLSKKKDMRSHNTSLSSTARVFCFCVAVIVIVPGSALVLILSILRKVFVNLLIGWKGLDLGSLTSMPKKFMVLVERLTGPLLIPSYLMAYMFYPLVLICKLVDAFNFEGFYSLLSVTCQGAKAPIELFIDSFVLGVSILFIKSNYNFLWAMTFREMNRALVVKHWIERKKLLSGRFILAVVFLLLASMNPFVTLLRFFLAYVNFAAFFVNNHVTHVLSPACIGIDGFQNQELLLVYATSILVWWLIPPILYSTSEIVCPNGGYAILDMPTPVLSGSQTIAESAPTGLPDSGENAGNRGNSDKSNASSSSIGSVVVSQCSDSEIPSVDTGSVVISEFSRGDSCNSFDIDVQISIGNSVPGSASASIDAGRSIAISSYNESETDYSIGDNSFRSINNESDTDYSIGESFRSIGLTPDEIASDREDAGTIETSEYYVNNDIDNKDNSSRHSGSSSKAVSWHDAHGPAAATATAADREEIVQDIESLAVVRSPAADWTYLGIATGMFLFAWSRVRVMLSADLLIVFVIHVYLSRCQKAFRLEQQRKMRANRRWEAHTVPQSIERFRLKRSSTRHPSLLPNQIDSEQTLALNDSKECRLPPYYQLCYMVQVELCRTIRVMYSLRPISTPISYLLSFTSIGHAFTSVGFQFWTVVVRKYIMFVCACLGIWFNKIYEAYRIEALVKEFSNGDPDETTIEFLKLTIASRVILLQALGETPTLISIAVINICEAPLFVFSPKLQEKIPPLLHLNPRVVALAREKKEVLGTRQSSQGQEQEQDQSEEGSFQIQEWVITTRSISIFLTESRLIVFLYNLVSLSLTIFVLKDVEISTEIVALLLVAMLPYYVGSTLIPILYIGKRLNLTDEDFRIVFLSWLSTPYEYCRATAVPIHTYFNRARVSVYSLLVGRFVDDCARPTTVHPINQEVLEEEVAAAVEPSGQAGVAPGEEAVVVVVREPDEEDSFADISIPSEYLICDSTRSGDGSESENDSIHIEIDEDCSSTDEGGSIAAPEKAQPSPLQTNERDSDAESSSVNVSEEDEED